MKKRWEIDSKLVRSP